MAGRLCRPAAAGAREGASDARAPLPTPTAKQSRPPAEGFRGIGRPGNTRASSVGSKSTVEGALRFAGKLDLLPEVFYDLAVPSSAKVTHAPDVVAPAP